MTNVPVKSLKFAQFDLNYKGSVVSIVLFCFCRKNDKTGLMQYAPGICFIRKTTQ